MAAVIRTPQRQARLRPHGEGFHDKCLMARPDCRPRLQAAVAVWGFGNFRVLGISQSMCEIPPGWSVKHVYSSSRTLCYICVSQTWTLNMCRCTWRRTTRCRTTSSSPTWGCPPADGCVQRSKKWHCSHLLCSLWQWQCRLQQKAMLCTGLAH